MKANITNYQGNSALKAFMGDNKAHVKEYETAQSILIRNFPDDSVP
jgi:hypothetical protein